MHKVAQVDDTIIVLETSFEDDCRSADSFKERILNTNLIINKTKRTSFGSGWEARPRLRQHPVEFNPSFTPRSTDDNLQLINLSSASEQEDDESWMVSVGGAKSRFKRLDSVSSLSS